MQNFSTNFQNSGQVLSRDEMKKIMAGDAVFFNPGCGESCLGGPVVPEYQCRGNCPICYADGQGSRYCVTSIC